MEKINHKNQKTNEAVNYNNKNGCYHLGKIAECIPELKYKVYLYHDDYSREFLKAVVLSIFTEQ